MPSLGSAEVQRQVGELVEPIEHLLIQRGVVRESDSEEIALYQEILIQ